MYTMSCTEIKATNLLTDSRNIAEPALVELVNGFHKKPNFSF